NTARNRTLSENRANSVIYYLVTKHKMDLNRLVQPFGYGQLEPVAENKTAAGRAKNRRVEIRLMKNKGIAGTLANGNEPFIVRRCSSQETSSGERRRFERRSRMIFFVARCLVCGIRPAILRFSIIFHLGRLKNRNIAGLTPVSSFERRGQRQFLTLGHPVC